MIVDRCQRWREGRAGFVVRGTRIDAADYRVALVEEREARPFVIDHHYSGSFPAARRCAGLYRGRRLVGVIVVSEPMQHRAVKAHTGIQEGAELGRLVLLDDVAGDGESWFASRALAMIGDDRRQIQTILSYSDPVERRAADGALVKPGHVGIVYQALSAHYRGVTGDRTEYLAAGRPISGRTLSKIRRGESGVDYAIGQLVALGAPPPTISPAPAIWLRQLKEAGFITTRRRTGNHVYVIPLTRRAKAAAGTLPRFAYPRRVVTDA